MKKLFQNTGFLLGLWCNLLVFLVLNFLCYLESFNKWEKQPKLIADAGNYKLDFPFSFRTTFVGYPTFTEFTWTGLAADFLVAVSCGIVIGIIVKSLTEWITARRIK
jgi:hypothetical protein